MEVQRLVIERDYNGHKAGLLYWRHNEEQGVILWAGYTRAGDKLNIRFDSPQGDIHPLVHKHFKSLHHVIKKIVFEGPEA